MRLKIICFFLLLGLLVLAFAVFQPKQSVEVPPAIVEAATNAAEQFAPVVTVKPVFSPPTQSVSTISPTLTPARTVEELESLAMNHDANSLQVILAELTNPDPEIRAAARSAAVQFGDRSAVPPLRAVASKTEDLDEKKALFEAADFLELPPLEVHSVTNLPPVK